MRRCPARVPLPKQNKRVDHPGKKSGGPEGVQRAPPNSGPPPPRTAALQKDAEGGGTAQGVALTQVSVGVTVP